MQIRVYKKCNRFNVINVIIKSIFHYLLRKKYVFYMYLLMREDLFWRTNVKQNGNKKKISRYIQKFINNFGYFIIL